MSDGPRVSLGDHDLAPHVMRVRRGEFEVCTPHRKTVAAADDGRVFHIFLSGSLMYPRTDLAILELAILDHGNGAESFVVIELCAEKAIGGGG